ncbi:MAG: hypothetical protein ACI9DQ_001256, partial [Glaciecola sp.]
NITSVTISFIAVLFGSKQREVNSDIQHNLSKINKFKTQR